MTRSVNRLRKIIGDCRFFYLRDITQSAVETYSGRLKKEGYGHTSRGHYLSALVTFLNWASTDRRILTNPLAKLEMPKRDSKKKGVLTPEQFIALVKTTFGRNVLIGSSSGAERAVQYLLAGMTGLRRKELLNVRWADICLSAGNAFVRVPAKLAMNSKEAEQKAVKFLPNFGDFVLSTCLDKICTRQEISRDKQRHKNGQETRKPAFLAAYRIPPRGVEPLSPG